MVLHYWIRIQKFLLVLQGAQYAETYSWSIFSIWGLYFRVLNIHWYTPQQFWSIWHVCLRYWLQIEFVISASQYNYFIWNRGKASFHFNFDTVQRSVHIFQVLHSRWYIELKWFGTSCTNLEFDRNQKNVSNLHIWNKVPPQFVRVLIPESSECRRDRFTTILSSCQFLVC